MDQIETDAQCPFCFEWISVLIDDSVSKQSYVEDCQVCCRPIRFEVECEEGAVTSLDLIRD